MSNEMMKAVEQKIRARNFSSANRSSTRDIKCVRIRAKYHSQLSELGLIKDYLGGQLSLESFVSYYQSHKITAEQLPALRSVFSEVKDVKNYSVFDAENSLIQVNLSCGSEADNAMCFYYVTELPADAKCKIVTESYNTIACGL